MSPKPILYYALFSPPARACILTAKIIGLDLELKCTWTGLCAAAKLNQLQTSFIECFLIFFSCVINHCTVSLYSHAIVCFMVSKYAKSDQLYPQDLKRRAHIDHRLHYENGVLFQVVKDIVARNIYGGEPEYSQRSLELCQNAYATLEQFLQQGSFVVGNELSVADISICTTLITLDLLVPVEQARYPQIHGWLARMQQLLPDYEELNLAGARALQQRIENCMAEHKAKAAQ
ncbi:hypothetical protein KR222_009516 [Zaprionus bogoriensis]|nr:hypothetical protein KR222_009516 [Zaprionus bogoriensis]